MKRNSTKPQNSKRIWLVHAIPLLWLAVGILYARSLDAWAGIGVLLMVLVSTAGLLCGTIVWHITKKPWYAVFATLLGTGLFFFLLVLLARLG